MICPKCGSKHIRPDGSCLMCGQMVRMDEERPIRTCLACGREERFIGSVCRDCETAISLGAVALKKAAQRNFNSEKAPVFAVCPVLKPLEELAEKFRAWREHKLALHRECQRRYNERHPDARRKYLESEKGKAATARYESSPERIAQRREQQRRYRQERVANDPEYAKKRLEDSKRWRREQLADPEKRAAFLEKRRAWYREYYHSEAQKAKREANKEKRRERMREWQRNYRATHPEAAEKMREYSRKYHWAHREQVLERKNRDRELERLRRDNERLEKANQEAA